MIIQKNSEKGINTCGDFNHIYIKHSKIPFHLTTLKYIQNYHSLGIKFESQKILPGCLIQVPFPLVFIIC